MQPITRTRVPAIKGSYVTSSVCIGLGALALSTALVENSISPTWAAAASIGLGGIACYTLYKYGTAVYAHSKANIALADTQASFRHLFDAIPDALVVLDNQGRILDANAALVTLTGYTREELLELWAFNLTPVRMRTAIPALLRNAHNGGVIDWICSRKDDTTVPIEIGYRTIQIDGTERILLSIRDLSTREHAERQLRASENRYRSLFEKSLDGIYRSTPEGHFIDANPALVEMLGYASKEELLTINIPSDLYFNHAERRSADQRNTVFTSRLRRKDGSQLWVEVNSWVVCDEEGKVLYYEGITRDITERKRYEETIWYQAYHDALTGLPNRYLFHDRLNHALAQARRTKSLVGVMFLDLDHFKNINDTLGHGVGDQLLQMVAGRLLSCLREGDTVARLGGDEFTLLLQLGRPEDATRVARRIHEVLSPPFPLDGHELHVTASIGISIFPLDAEDVDTLLKNADTALFRSKEQGRNNHHLYSPTMNASAVERLMLENGLRHALGRNEFVLFYQPIARTSTGKISAVEALLRWQRPGTGITGPDAFISLAEETGLITPIGEWVLRTACAQAQQWQTAYNPPIRIAVNLSARQFNQHKLVDTVKSVLRESGLNPNLLTLEITENTALQNIESTAATLRKLTELGVQVAIDDFGTGYSSLSLLKRLPLHTLKIDKTFVRNLTSDPGDAAIVSAVIAMAHSLQLQVVAEGVEIEEQVQFLRSRECDAMQGYLISHPVPADELTKLLHTCNQMEAEA